VYGGNGNDTITSGGQGDALYGEEGNDTLLCGSNPNGSVLFSGGTGTDTIDFSLRRGALNITMDGVANDGEANEGDNVYPDIETVIGGNGDDVINCGYVTNAALLIRGGNGVDSLTGGALNDTIMGEAGGDTLTGAQGNDLLIGGYGNDLLNGGTSLSGADTLEGDLGLDTVDYSQRTANISITSDGVANDGETGEGDSVLADIETIIGGAGNDYIAAVGAYTNPVLIRGGAGNDTLSGGASDDTLMGDDGNDSLVGAMGNDWLQGGNGNDTLQGGSGIISGADILEGDAGSDTADYSGRTNSISVSQDNTANDGELLEGDSVRSDIETILGGAGNDYIVATSVYVPVLFHGGAGNDTIIGGAQSDTLLGEDGNDSIQGGMGDDLMAGGNGNDTLQGGTNISGADTLEGDAGVDTADYSNRTAGVSLTLDNVSNDGESGEGDNLNDDVEYVIGGAGNDLIDASSVFASVTLIGNAGADTLMGGSGSDLFYSNTLYSNGDSAVDQVFGGAGTDVAHLDNFDLTPANDVEVKGQ